MRLGLLLLVLIPTTQNFAQTSTDCAEWKVKYATGNYKMYMRECKFSPIKEVRVTDKFFGDFKHLQQVMVDVETAKKMVESCKEARMIEQIDNHTAFYYYSYKMPVSVKDRDIVTKTTTHTTDSTYTYISETVENDLVKLSSNFIRIKNARSAWHFKKTASGEIEMEYVAFADPNGNIPAWLINSLARHQVWESIQTLKKLIND